MMEKITVCTFNCKHVKSSIEEVRRLCYQNDIVLLQETWLFKHDLFVLNDISATHFAQGVSSIDSDHEILTGRPYGGLAILWRKTLGHACRVITYDDNRVMGIEITSSQNSILILNVYLPYCSEANQLDFDFYLSKLKDLIDAHKSPHTLVFGDFNSDVLNGNHKFGNTLKDFVENEGLIVSDVTHINVGDNPYTYIAPNGSTSWLDHIISTVSGHALLDCVGIDYNFVSSDHLPLLATLNTGRIGTVNSKKPVGNPRIKWENVSADQREEYYKNTEAELSKIPLDHGLILCDNVKCSDPSHRQAIDIMYQCITNALSGSSEFMLKKAGTKQKQVPGWNEVVKEAHQLARESFLCWRSRGSPRQGFVFQQMKTHRAQFKLALRKCKNDRTRREADCLAKHHLAKDSKSFWKSINNIMGNNSSVYASGINGATCPEEICSMWQKHYEAILNSSLDQSSETYVSNRLNCINEMDTFERITHHDILAAVKSLKMGKTHGHDGLSGEHFKYSSNKLMFLLAIVFNCMIIHSYLPDDLMISYIIPVLKDKKGDISSKDNYRPIAITSIMSKIIEIVFLSRYSEFLESSHNQFGYKNKLSTETCIFTLKEIINYYRFYSSNVYLCFLDASKAFDKINHFHLFKKLIKRDLPIIIVRFLFTWYRSQTFAVKWLDNISAKFTSSNGVRQGSVLSPKLFSVFMDELSVNLNMSKIGCHMNNTSFNHIFYADDAVILSPSVKGLQKLLNICQKFAIDNEIVYNPLKTKCMHIRKRGADSVNSAVYLNDIDIKWVESYKYLGIYLSSDLKEDTDIKRQIKSIYSRGNILIRKFRGCTNDIKCLLFQSFCTNFYCSSLWSSFNMSTIHNAKVAFNNVFRYLLGIRERCSISQLFLNNNVDSFYVLLRKSIFNLYMRLKECDNALVSCVLNSFYFYFQSPLFLHWKRQLYNTF